MLSSFSQAIAPGDRYESVEQLVTDEHEAALRSRIVAAVQAELDRYAATVVAETQKLRADALRERDDVHAEFSGRISELTRAVDALSEQLHQQVATRASDAKVAEVESRLNRRIEQVTTNVGALVDDAARPHLQSIHDEQEHLGSRVDVLATDLRKFDEQAARLVVYFNEMTTKMKQGVDESAERFHADVRDQIRQLESRLEGVEEASLRQHVETSKLVNDRSERLEERMNIKVSTVEGSIREEVGSRIAEIDAHVGRVAQGLDDTLNVLGDRIATIEESVRRVDERVDGLREEFGSVDTESLDELKEKLSAAAGEAMLVRIDLEHLEKATNERVESANARLATVESQLADATMDVSTAIQLERLEELERAVIELSPANRAPREDVGSDHATEEQDPRGTA